MIEGYEARVKKIGVEGLTNYIEEGKWYPIIEFVYAFPDGDIWGRSFNLKVDHPEVEGGVIFCLERHCAHIGWTDSEWEIRKVKED